MKKSFSIRNIRYASDIETIIDIDYEMDEDGTAHTRTSYRVVKHGMGRSRTILNNQQWEQISESMRDNNLQCLEWLIDENKKNRANLEHKQTQGEQQ